MFRLSLSAAVVAAAVLGASSTGLAGPMSSSYSSGHGSGGSTHISGGFTHSSEGFTHSPGISHRSVPSAVPGMAFGGTALRRSDSVESWRDSGSVGGFRRADGLPLEVSRGWDLTSRHFWNRHYYVWSGGGWVIYDDSPGVDSYVQGPPEVADTAEPDDAPPPPAPAPFAGSLAAQVQQELARRGYDPGPVDGTLGQQTREAIATFQEDQGLDATGRIGIQLLSALGLR